MALDIILQQVQLCQGWSKRYKKQVHMKQKKINESNVSPKTWTTFESWSMELPQEACTVTLMSPVSANFVTRKLSNVRSGFKKQRKVENRISARTMSPVSEETVIKNISKKGFTPIIQLIILSNCSIKIFSTGCVFP